MSEQLDKDLRRMLSLLGHSTNLIERAKLDKGHGKCAGVEKSYCRDWLWLLDKGIETQPKEILDEMHYHR